MNEDKESSKDSTNESPEQKSNQKPTEKTQSEEETALTKTKVEQFIEDGTLYAGNPPSKRNAKASYWRKGLMRYLFFSDSKELCENWYYCEQCQWVIYVVKGGGTSAIKNHVDKHLKEAKYRLTKAELASLLAQATNIGHSRGFVTEKDFQQIMFKPVNWNSQLDQFWENVQNCASVSGKIDKKVDVKPVVRSTRASSTATLQTNESKAQSSNMTQTKPTGGSVENSPPKRMRLTKGNLIKAVQGMPLDAKKRKLYGLTKDMPEEKRQKWCEEILGEYRAHETQEFNEIDSLAENMKELSSSTKPHTPDLNSKY